MTEEMPKDPTFTTELQNRAIAGYCLIVIENYLNDIRAAAYPQPPENYPAYEYFNAHYQNILRIVNGETLVQVSDSLKREREALQNKSDKTH